MSDSPITDLLDQINEGHAKYENSTEQRHIPFATQMLLTQYRRLIETLDLRAYPVEEGTDDRSEQVIITVHNVDVSVRGRYSVTGGDLFVHIDPDDRDPDDAAAYPLTVEVGDGGENTYGV
jgi:hypothetical protein